MIIVLAIRKLLQTPEERYYCCVYIRIEPKEKSPLEIQERNPFIKNSLHRRSNYFRRR